MAEGHDSRRTRETQDALIRFHERYFADQAAGQPRSLVEYMADHRGFEEEVAREYLLITEAAPPANPTELRRFGAYDLIEQLGRGGQAVVWLAQDRRLGRRVALKIMQGFSGASQDDLDRFRREARIASRLEHPNLCPVFDSGVEDGVPWIAMRHVPGRTLSALIAEASGGVGSLSRVDHWITLMETVARAVHVAHESGVVHRDLKPGNIMVTEKGTPIVLDFGLARMDSEDLATLTQSGAIMGTPAYMAPEQVKGARKSIGRRTDVYALGVMLYECVTLRVPFEGPTPAALFEAIVHDAPSRPGGLNPRVGRDLEIVIEAAMEKEPARRYTTAEALADDLERVRMRQPIRARPLSPIVRSSRWLRRNRTVAFTVAATILTLLIGLAGMSHFALRETRAKREAQHNEQLALRAAHRGRLAIAAMAIERHDAATADHELKATDPGERGWAWRHLSTLIDVSEASVPLPSGMRFEAGVGWARDGSVLVWGRDGEVASVARWDGSELTRIHEQGGVHGFVVAAGAGQLLSIDDDSRMELRALSDTRPLFTACLPSPAARRPLISPDGRRVAALTANRDGAWIWDVGGDIHRLNGDEITFDEQLRFSAVIRDETLAVVNASTGEVLASTASDAATPVGVSTDGCLVAVKSAGIRLLRRVEDRLLPLHELLGPDEDGTSVHFVSPPGDRIDLVVDERTIGSWSTTTGESELRIGVPADSIVDHAASPDGRRLATIDKDGFLRIWSLDLATDPWWQPSTGRPVLGVEPSNRWLVAVSQHEVAVLDGRSDMVTRVGPVRHEGHVEQIEVWPGGHRMAFVMGRREGRPSAVRVIDTTTGEILHDLGRETLIGLVDISISPDGRLLAAQDERFGLVIWDGETCEQRAHVALNAAGTRGAVAFSPAGDLLAVKDGENRIAILAVEDLSVRRRFEGHTDAITDLAFRPDAREVASTSQDGTARLWPIEGRDGSEPPSQVRVLTGHFRTVYQGAYAPDGNVFATVSRDRTLRLWDLQSYEELFRIRPKGLPRFVAFTPDGHRLVTAAATGVRAWSDVFFVERRTRLREALEIRSRLAPRVAEVVGAVGLSRARVAIGAELRSGRDREIAEQLLLSHALTTGD